MLKMFLKTYSRASVNICRRYIYQRHVHYIYKTYAIAKIK